MGDLQASQFAIKKKNHISKYDTLLGISQRILIIITVLNFIRNWLDLKIYMYKPNVKILKYIRYHCDTFISNQVIPKCLNTAAFKFHSNSNPVLTKGNLSSFLF